MTSSGTELAWWSRVVRALRPSHQHSAYSATILLMGAVMLSRVIGYLREAYIAWAFGAGLQTDAFVAAFTIPDWLNYLVAGASVSITFISIYTRCLEEGREAEAHRAFSIIITVMSTVLLAGILLAEIFTPQIERVVFPGFTAEQLALCVYLTRILLPAQLFFYVGGVVSAVLLARRMFLIPALGPLLYNVGIILGGVLLSRRLGIASLAYGAVAGCIAGPFLINAIGAAHAGVRYRPSFDIGQSAFREWVRLTIPLMLGVTLVAMDDWILRFFASHGAGDISRLNYAKRLFGVPIAVLGQAIGQASLPFFAALYGKRQMREFAAAVNGGVYRIAAASFLVSAWMMASALPVIDLVYRRGRFQFSDSRETAAYFFWFALSLTFWSAQALYSRAFYSAGNTFTPMVAGSLVTIASLAVYWALFHSLSIVGLAIASDIGIAAHTVTLALLLHRRGLVPISGLPGRELAKAAAAAVVAGLLAHGASRVVAIDGTRRADVIALALASAVWAGAVALCLWITNSDLPRALRRRPAAANNSARAKEIPTAN